MIPLAGLLLAATPYIAAYIAAANLATPRDCSGGVDGASGSSFLLEPGDNASKAATLAAAEKAIEHRAGSVFDKKASPPSGDRHDYMSLAPYWWPDPTDALAPWTRRDGEMNPAREGPDYDRIALGRMVADVDALARGYAGSGERRYALRAATLLRTWFLDPATRMNPNMNYAQAIPGRNSGRGAGVIDGAGFHQVIDAVQRLAPAYVLGPAERGSLENWFSRYVDWLLTSENGRAERAARNNHGLWYDSQLAHFALFARRPEIARAVVGRFPAQRLSRQVAPDGSLPEELTRTRSFHYSLYALDAAYDVAAVGRCLGVDLWNWRDRKGRSLQRATDYVAAYRGRPQAWPRRELKWPAAELDALLARADRIWPGRYTAQPVSTDTDEILRNRRGMTVVLSPRGAAIRSISIDGRELTVTPDASGFARSRRRYGAIIGRFAGRLPGAIDIGGRHYQLEHDASGVTLHGGDPGFDRALWRARRLSGGAGEGIEFSRVSADGEQGFPGNLTVAARYRLDQRLNRLRLDVTAATDRPTAVNLTNHVYFNLGSAPTIACHHLRVPADRITAADERKLPTGAFTRVAGTRFDLKSNALLEGAVTAGGIDALYVMSGREVRLSDVAGGRMLTVATNQPAVQVFTGNAFDGQEHRTDGSPIERFAGVAIEPQALPGSRATRITPSRPLRWRTRWTFGATAARRCA